MDTVELDGVQYTKASVVAKSFRYTNDYVGQLCRAKKVDARLVGRTWFVNIDSIKTYRKTKYKTKSTPDAVSSTSSAAGSKMPSNLKPYRVEVNPVLQNKTAKNVHQTEPAEHSRNLHVFYDIDDESLLPQLTRKKTKPPRKITIRQVGSQNVNIKNREKQANFVPEPLPEVSLSGKLHVTSYVSRQADAQDGVEETLASATNVVMSLPAELDHETPASDSKSVLDINPNNKLRITKISPKHAPVLVDTQADEAAPAEHLTAVAGSTNVSVPFTVPTLQLKHETSVSSLVLLSPLLATLCAAICVLIIFSASTVVILSDSTYDSRVVFQVANVIDFFYTNR